MAAEIPFSVNGKPSLAVTVASQNARASIEECLSTIVDQAQVSRAEIIVVDNSTDGTTELVQKQFPHIKLIVESPTLLIPELWGVGIQQSTADIVAITTAHFVPGKDWLAQILKAHETEAPAIGGAIENDESGRIVDWAVFFCRYSLYMLPFPEGVAPEIAGDNASYKREYLDRYQYAWRNGFWESAVHAEMRKAGIQLLLVPSIVVRHKRSFGCWSFMTQRFQHGVQFGSERASRCSVPRRVFYIMLSPAIPLIFLVRIVRQLIRKQRHWGKFIHAFLILILFLSAWTVGELIGYLRGATR